MAQPAKITSIEAIAAFRTSLILYLSKVRPALEEVSTEVARTRSWLQNDQRRHWENELRRRRRRLEEAQAELFNAKISLTQKSTQLPHMLVQRTKQAVEEAEDKLKVLKRWEAEMENRTDPLTKQVEQLHGFMTTDMARAAAQLAQLVTSLDAYTDTRPPSGASSSAAAAEGDHTSAT